MYDFCPDNANVEVGPAGLAGPEDRLSITMAGYGVDEDAAAAFPRRLQCQASEGLGRNLPEHR